MAKNNGLILACVFGVLSLWGSVEQRVYISNVFSSPLYTANYKDLIVTAQLVGTERTRNYLLFSKRTTGAPYRVEIIAMTPSEVLSRVVIKRIAFIRGDTNELTVLMDHGEELYLGRSGLDDPLYKIRYLSEELPDVSHDNTETLQLSVVLEAYAHNVERRALSLIIGDVFKKKKIVSRGFFPRRDSLLKEMEVPSSSAHSH